MSDDFPLLQCPACQGRRYTMLDILCPWCLDGQVSVDVAAVYWRIRQVSPYEFHSVFGARVPIDRKNRKRMEP